MQKWLENAVFYQLYPQSFQDSNADGIGDIKGIIRRLDYIRELGCNAIWLNPCFVSPFHDAGYDVADYYTVAPRYGTNEDLKDLFDEAHKRQIRVILDLIPGHTSIQHPWFQESMKGNDNPYAGRYIWADTVWESLSGIENINGTITGFCQRGACAVNFFSTQPALNYGFANPDRPWQSAVDSPEALSTRKALLDIMKFWLNMGCDGFRVDLAGSLVKGDPDQKETIRLWQDILACLHKGYPDAAIISEWGNPERSLISGFDMDFLLHVGDTHYMDLFRENPYFSRSGKGDVTQFIRRYRQSYEATNGRGLICIPSSNHDMRRISHQLDQEELKLAFAFLLSVPGAPFIYYGDEIGMRYLEGIPSVEGGYERTGSRSPMQWDTSLNAGFSAAREDKLYIPLDDSENRPNVKDQMERPDSLWREVQKLIKIRMEQEPLQSMAGIEFLSAENGAYPLVYKREGKTGSILIAINPSGQQAQCPVGEQGLGEILYAYNGNAVLRDGVLTVPPCSASFMEV